MAYASVFFDADGTLFDDRACERAAMLATIEEFRIAADPEALIVAFRTHSLGPRQISEDGATGREAEPEECFRRLAAEFGFAGESVAAVSESYLGHFSRQTTLLPGAFRC